MDFGAYELKNYLHPKFFRDDKLIPIVRTKLLKIARTFWKDLELKEKYEDVLLTGSIAGYNWNKFSDVDLHIVTSYSVINDDVKMVEDFLWSKSKLWNTTHDILFFKHEVELNCQNSEINDLISTAVYSVLYDDWIIHPDLPDGVKINFGRVGRYLAQIRDKFNKMLYRYNSKDYNGLYNEFDRLKDSLYDMRQFGLQGAGEYSPENIAFKILRNDGVLDDVKDLRNKLSSQDLSLDKKDLDNNGDKSSKQKEDEKEPDAGEGHYLIGGRRFPSLRIASKVLGIPKSTIEYRLKSDNPKWSDYRIIEV